MVRALVLRVYKASESFPPEEIYGLRRQLRNAALSVAANIAEGFGRYHHKDNLKFLYNARGSLAEMESFLLLAADLGYVDATTADEMRALCQRDLRLLNGYIKSLKTRIGGQADDRLANHSFTNHLITSEAL